MGGSHHEEITRDKLTEPLKKDTYQQKLYNCILNVIDGPVTWYRESVMPKIRQTPQPYYHRRYSRVKTIDQCEVGDIACFVEANEQFKRDKLVEAGIVRILMSRKAECIGWYSRVPEDVEKYCKKAYEDCEEATTNFFIKYGDLGYYGNVRDALMKQKHRMLWERRNGPVGSVRQAEEAEKETAVEEPNMFTVLRNSFGRSRLPKEIQQK